MRLGLVFITIFVVGCMANAPECSTDSDCVTPDEFLLQSNCPFGSACIDDECRVVCQFTTHDPNPEISESYPLPCDSDSDCDCSDRGNRTLECVCHNGGCLSVEK